MRQVSETETLSWVERNPELGPVISTAEKFKGVSTRYASVFFLLAGNTERSRGPGKKSGCGDFAVAVGAEMVSAFIKALKGRIDFFEKVPVIHHDLVIDPEICDGSSLVFGIAYLTSDALVSRCPVKFDLIEDLISLILEKSTDFFLIVCVHSIKVASVERVSPHFLCKTTRFLSRWLGFDSSESEHSQAFAKDPESAE